MPLIALAWIIGGAGTFKLVTSAIEDLGQGLNETSNAAIKLGGAALIGYYLFTQVRIAK